MKKYYCKELFCDSYNVTIALDVDDDSEQFCKQCENKLELISPSLFNYISSFVESNSKIIYPILIISFLFLLGYNFYEPKFKFSSIPIIEVLEDEKYAYTPLVKNYIEDYKIEAIDFPVWMRYDENDRVLLGRPSNKDVGTHDIILIAHDNQKDTISQIFSVKVVNTNDPPQLVGRTPAAYVDSVYSFVPDFDDPDGDENIVIKSISPKGGWLSLDTKKENHLYGVPDANNIGNFNYSITLNDGYEDVDININISVSLGNMPPTFSGLTLFESNEDEFFEYDLKIYDQDNDKINIQIDNLPYFINVSNNYKGIILKGTPSGDDIGSHEMKITFDDGITKSQSQVFVLEVKNTNDPPEIMSSSDDIWIKEDEVLNYTLKYEDEDGDPVDIIIVALPDWVKYNKKHHILSGNPIRGNNNVIIKAIDSHGAEDEISFNIRVARSDAQVGVLDWEAITLSDYYNSSKANYKNIDELLTLTDNINALEIQAELYDKLNLNKNLRLVCYLVDPNDCEYVGSSYRGKKCIKVTLSPKDGVSLNFKNNYKIKEYKKEYIFVIKN